MVFETDTHCHTVASGHAYSTIGEMVQSAAAQGIKLMAVTDHGPAMPDAPGITFFRNLRVIPGVMAGVEILKGAEVNIMSFTATLDLSDTVLRDLDFVIASLHYPCIKPGTRQENTAALVSALENPYVHALGHIGNPLYPIDGHVVVAAAKKNRKFIEINNSSLKPTSFRKGSWEYCLTLLSLCKEAQLPVILGSDAHIACDVGLFDEASALIKEACMPEELILSTKAHRLKNHLSSVKT